MSQNGGCHLQISAGHAVTANFRITMSGVESYFGAWLKECPHLKFMDTVAETRTRTLIEALF